VRELEGNLRAGQTDSRAHRNRRLALGANCALLALPFLSPFSLLLWSLLQRRPKEGAHCTLTKGSL